MRDLDEIYAYIARNLSAPDTALQLVDGIEKAILCLEEAPFRGAERRTGVYAQGKYRQLFVKNYTVVYRIDEQVKTVVIVTVRYSPRMF